MPTQREVTLALLLGLCVTHDIRTRLRLYKIARLASTAIEQHEENDERNRQKIEYLLYLLNKSNVKVDDFDKIALDALDFKVK